MSTGRCAAVSCRQNKGIPEDEIPNKLFQPFFKDGIASNVKQKLVWGTWSNYWLQSAEQNMLVLYLGKENMLNQVHDNMDFWHDSAEHTEETPLGKLIAIQNLLLIFRTIS